ncbi:MAG: hypothetical protein H0W13_03360 [Nitrospirales bacterium]|nr:hypothetical protein [Nitrospirales bacterium]
MGDHHKKSVEELAAEITGPIVEAIVAAGGNRSDGHMYETQRAKQTGEAVRAIYEEVFKGVLGSLKSGKSSAVPNPSDLVDRVTGKPVLPKQ